MNAQSTPPPVFGASQQTTTFDPWAGYPRKALFAEARIIRDVEGISLTEALDRVVRAFDRDRKKLEAVAAFIAGNRGEIDLYAAIVCGDAPELSDDVVRLYGETEDQR